MLRRARGLCFAHLGLCAGQTCFRKETDHFAAHALDHRFEEVEALELVDQQRILLLDGCVLHATAQFVHLAQVFLPLVVDDGEGDVLLHAGDQLAALALVGLGQVGHHLHGLHAVGDGHHDVLVLLALVQEHVGDHRHGLVGGHFAMSFVALQRRIVHLFDQLFALDALELIRGYRAFGAQLAEEFQLERFEVAALVVFVHDARAHLVEHVEDVQLQALAEQRVVTTLVDHRPLAVHHIIILQQAFPDAEVVLLHFLLCPLDARRHHPVLDHLAFLQAHGVHQFAYPLAVEETHQVIFQRHVELR